MALDTYLNLKASVIEWSKRGDVVSLVDDFIDLAESHIWQKLRIRAMEGIATGNLSGSTLALPSDFIESRKLRLTTNPSTELSFSTPEAMTTKQGNGKPTAYTIRDVIEFNATPDSTYGYELTYYKSLDALSASASSNAVLASFPMIYLYGALYYLFVWAQDAEMAVNYLTLFENAIDSANQRDKSGRYPSGKAMRSEGFKP